MAESKSTQYLRSVIKKFPNSPATTLAKAAYRDHPEMWRSVESCRSAIRGILGVRGKRNRLGKNFKDKSLYREPRQAGDTSWVKDLPSALESMDSWGPVCFDGPLKALVIADSHIPYHDPLALQTAIEYGLKRNVDTVILLGDIFDHYAISRWETDPRQRDFPAEVRTGKQFLAGVRKTFPKAHITFLLGNHEERYERFLRLKAPELLGIPDFAWQSVFGLEDFKIDLVNGKRPIRLGSSLNLLHGHEYTFAISNPVSPARGLFLRAKANAICGHFHQSSQHSERNLEQKVITTFSIGCTCDLHPEYRPLNTWSQGGAIVEIDKKGAFHVENFRILHGSVW